LPGTKHPLAAYFTRGSGHNEKGAYTERPDDYVRNIDRVNRKTETAKKYIPAPLVDWVNGADVGIIAYGSSDSAMKEARDNLAAKGIKTNYMTVRALPLTDDVKDFIAKNRVVYLVEQNRDAQMLRLVLMERMDPQEKVKSVLHYNGFTIDAKFISENILQVEGVVRV